MYIGAALYRIRARLINCTAFNVLTDINSARQTYLGDSFRASHFRLHLCKVVIVGGNVRHNGLVIRSCNIDI